jgi:glycosyltransferase involved in cell wall biosynthesis
VYRTELYLAGCPASILRQTLKAIQVVVGDDGSPGEVQQIVQRVAAGDRRVTLLRHKTNQGTLAARLTGARAATAPYLAFVDPDDSVDKRFLETMYRTAQRYDADITQCGILMVEQDMSQSLINRGGGAHYHDDVFGAFLSGKMSNALFNKLIRTDCWREAILKLPSDVDHLSFGEDLLILFFISTAAGRYAHLPNPLYTYFLRPNSATTTNSAAAAEVRASSLRRILDILTPTLARRPEPADLKQLFLEREFGALSRIDQS